MEIQFSEHSHPGYCFWNVRQAVEAEGGAIAYGWEVGEHPGFLVAEHHAVWRDKNGILKDISPGMGDQSHRLFLEDEAALPLPQQNNEDGIQLGPRFQALTDDAVVLKALDEIDKTHLEFAKTGTFDETLQKRMHAAFKQLESYRKRQQSK
jgi:hypothetical protein